MLITSYQNIFVEAGCDEAGRGALAGPLFAAAVILPEGFTLPLLDDSKKLTEQARYDLRPIIEREAVAWAVAEVSQERIDQINILNATYEAMTQAVRSLSQHPQFLAIDGNSFKTDLTIPYRCLVGGDGLYANIAAASVLAKTYRDDRMVELSKLFPQYGWDGNKGYPTRAHRLAIAHSGISPHHRKTFNLLGDK